MLETLKNAFKNKDIRRRILIMLLLLLVFRIGCYIPVPGYDRSNLVSLLADNGNTFFELMDSVTGGALANCTLFALGIGPYINASIIMQLLCVGIPALERLSKQGEDGRKRITQYTRILTIVLAVVQAAGIIVNLSVSSDAYIATYLFGSDIWGVTAANWIAGVVLTVIFTGGAMIVMWLGERITDLQVGNGQSMIIFVGILATAGQNLISKFSSIYSNGTVDWGVIWEIVGFLILAVVIFFAIVTVDLAERKIPVQYAKQVKGRKMYGGQSSSIPMKISGSGVMPLIFAFAIISFPSMIISMADSDSSSGFASWWNTWMASGTWVYSLILCVLIFVFSFFYQSIQFNPDDVAKSIQQNGGFIQGIRPGKPTAAYLKKISNRITLFGAIYLTLVAFVPSLVFSLVTSDSDLLSVFSTTGILIVVSVALDFDKQLQSQLMMKQYKGFLK